MAQFLEILILGAVLGAGTIPGLATSTGTSDKAVNGAGNLMEAIGRLPLPIRLYMNCPRDNEEQKQRFISDLSPNSAARAPLETLVNMSIEVLEKDRTRILHGVRKESEQNASSDLEDIRSLGRATSVLVVALKGQPLNYEKAKVRERGDTMINAMLSALPHLWQYQISAYDAAIAHSDRAAVEKIKAAFITRRLKELNQSPESAPRGLVSQILQELEGEREEWVAMKDVIAVGLDNLTDAPELGRKANLALNPAEQRYNRSGESSYTKQIRQFSPLQIQTNNGSNMLQTPLEKLKAAQKKVAEALAQESRMH